MVSCSRMKQKKNQHMRTTAAASFFRFTSSFVNLSGSSSRPRRRVGVSRRGIRVLRRVLRLLLVLLERGHQLLHESGVLCEESWGKKRGTRGVVLSAERLRRVAVIDLMMLRWLLHLRTKIHR